VVGRARPQLTPELVVKAMGRATLTASGLLADAELLFEHGRWARATAVATLAIEEIGKSVLLKLIMLAANDKQRRALWNSYYQHSPKTLALCFPAITFMRGLEGKHLTFDEHLADARDFCEWLDEFKQDCFYSNCLGEHEWPIPSEICTPEDCLKIMNFARIVVNSQLPLSSEGELTLLLKHFHGAISSPRPAWGALWRAFSAEMQMSGYLHPQADPLALKMYWTLLAMTLAVGKEIVS